jgi:DNA-binding NarL/FixJ family response regulator
VSAETKVVMFSASIDRPVVVEAIARGAQGYVGEEKPVGAISEALEMAHRGQLAVDPRLLQESPDLKTPRTVQRTVRNVGWALRIAQIVG